MKSKLLVTLLAVCAALAIAGAQAIPFLHEDIATGGLDPDGDHLLTGGAPGVADPMPGVFCEEGHSDLNRNGAVTAGELSTWLPTFGAEPPAAPFHDQNHNDQGDILDFVQILSDVGSSIATACAVAVADVPMPMGVSAIAGADLAMDLAFAVPQPPLPGPWGDIVVTVSTAGPVPDAYTGYWIDLRFNEASVAGVAASFTDVTAASPCLQELDNIDDGAGDDGHYRAGCGSFAGAGFAVAGDLATFTFDRIGVEEPRFCLQTFGPPDSGLALNGTYTFSGATRTAHLQVNTTADDPDGDAVPVCADVCPADADPGQLDNDRQGGPFGGTPAWIPDELAVPEGDTLGGNACDINDDNDLSCTDGEETTLVLATGGMRSPLNPWDFADVPVPALPAPAAVRNGAVTLGDVAAALVWVGTVDGGAPNVNGVDYDDDDNGNGIEDGMEYDRTPGGEISGPPSGAVALADVGVILAQVGDSCAALPN